MTCPALIVFRQHVFSPWHLIRVQGSCFCFIRNNLVRLFSSGKLASQHYNQAIRENCIHRGMIDYLRCTPPEFASPILAHFRMRREQILATCGVWLAEAQESISTPQRDRVRAMVGDEGHGQSHYSRLKSLVGELRGLLEKL